MYHRYLFVLFLIVITLAVFWRVQDHEFVWDDHRNIAENPYLNPVTFPNVLRFWQEPYRNLYIPVTYTVWATMTRFAPLRTTDGGGKELDPRLFHRTNLTFHLLSVLVVFGILSILVRNDWAACCGALLFALHPVQVETVAWVTGLKDVLSGFLSLVAVWQYLVYASARATDTKGESGKHAETWVEEKGALSLKGKTFHYALGTLAFMLAMLSKPSAVVVPVVAWVLDYWVLGRSMRQSAVALIGWIVLAMPFIVLAKWAQSDSGLDFVTPLWARPLVLGDAVAFYLYSLALPLWLGPDYGRTPELILRQGWIYITWIVPFSLAVLLWLWRDQRPWLVASVGIFVIGILPVSGLVPFVFQKVSTVADRYLYVSMLGPALGLAFLLSQRRRLLPVGVVCLVILGFLGIKSAMQTRYWQSTYTLFNHALRVNPNSWTGHNNLGVWLASQGKLEEAIQHYHEVFRIDPNYVKAYHNLGNALLSQGKLEEAIGQYRQALRINPAYSSSMLHNNLGIALAEQGRIKEAIGHFREGLRKDPTHPNNAWVHTNLGNLLVIQGEFEMAIEHYRVALKLVPELAEAHERLGRLLTQYGEREEAIQHLEEALRIMKSGNASNTRKIEKRVLQ